MTTAISRWELVLYEVWFSRGTGLVLGPKFRRLDDAKRYVEDHRDLGSMAIRAPNGRWEVIVTRARQPDAGSVRSQPIQAERRA